MRLITRAAGAMLAITSCLLLGGCLPTQPSVIPTSSPTAAPVFATEEEALAAAIEAYEAYLAVSTQVAHDGGNQPERLGTVATGEALESEVASFGKFLELGYTGTGAATFDTVELRSVSETGHVDAYLCVDFSATDILAPDGSSIVDHTAASRVAFEVRFEPTSVDPPVLTLAESAPWGGVNSC